MASIIQVSDAEICVQDLKSFELNEIGTKAWFHQHVILEKLNIQAAKSVASMADDEFIKGLLVNYQKTPIVIHNLIVTECWRKHLFTVILEKTDSDTICFPIFFVLHHQLTLTGLLETLIYHLDVCHDGEEFLTDLVDFCHRQIIDLIDRNSMTADGTIKPPECIKESREMVDMSNREELECQAIKMDFQVGIKSISILCHVIDHLNDLPLGIRSRLLCSHDTPMVLVQLLESPPWIREDQTGNQFQYDGSQWIELEDKFKVRKLDGKVWICLFRLIHESDNARKYDFNDFRKSNLLKLRPLLLPVLLDQMPYLEPLRRTLEELAFHNTPPAKKDLVIEQVAVIWESIRRKWEGKWDALAEEQVVTVFNCSPEVVQEQAKSLSTLYSFDVLEKMLPLVPQSLCTNKCAANCGRQSASTKRCSRCKSQWYCSKESAKLMIGRGTKQYARYLQLKERLIID